MISAKEPIKLCWFFFSFFEIMFLFIGWIYVVGRGGKERISGKIQRADRGKISGGNFACLVVAGACCRKRGGVHGHPSSRHQGRGGMHGGRYFTLLPVNFSVIRCLFQVQPPPRRGTVIFRRFTRRGGYHSLRCRGICRRKAFGTGSRLSLP